ncbi:MAG: M48 family peptidase, partial [Betaproteobacteria bacterium]
MDVNPAPDSLSLLTWAFAGLVAVQALVRLVLLVRQVRHVQRHRAQVPAAFAQRVSLADHQKAADYSSAKAQLEG